MKSRFQGLLLAFIATLTIYALVRSNISEKIPISLHFLDERTTKEIREDMCSKSSDLEDFYRTTGPNYDYNPPSKNEYLTKFIKDFITNSPNSKEIGINELQKYLSDHVGYILILFLFIILVILWLPYCICICRKSCCCIPNCCIKYPKFLVFCCIALGAIVLINCFIGYTENNNIIDGIYGIGCSILKVEQHLLEGDEFKSQKPYWIGVSTILTKLQEISDNITSLSEKTEEIKNQLKNDVNPLFSKFSSDLVEEYNTRINEKVSNPDPYNSTEFSPLYLQSYGPPNKKYTPLNFINEEINEYKDYTFEAINSVLNILNDASDYKDTAISKIEDIKEDLDRNIKDIDNSIATNINKYNKTFDKVDSFARKSINILFTVNLIIAIIVAVSLITIFCCNKGLVILCFSWFFLYVLMLITFFLASIFGLMGSFAQDASSGVYYLMNNLDEINNLDNQIKDIAQVCLKGNGSLAQSNLIPSDFNLSIIDNAYALEKVIDDGIIEIGNYNLKSIETNDQIYDSILISKYNISEIISPLENAQKFTDSSLGDDSYVKENSKFLDKWEINKNECGDYTYYSVSNILNNLFEDGSKLCLVITEWNREQIENRYKTIEPKKEEINILEKILNYYDNIMGFIDSNKELISRIKNKNKDFNETFHNIGLAEIKILNNTKDIIIPLREGLNEIVGDQSIFEILNCKFLKRDANKIIEVIYDSFGSTFKTTSNLLNIISAFELGMTLFVLLIMKAYGEKKANSDYIEIINNDTK